MLSLIIIVILLVLIDIVLIVSTTQMKRLSNFCESNESDFCPSYICPNGNPASRRNDEGKVLCSGADFIKEFKTRQDNGNCAG